LVKEGFGAKEFVGFIGHDIMAMIVQSPA